MTRWILMLVTPLLFAASNFAAERGPRNVVLFVVDDQGRDAGCYGNAAIKTPHLDALAKEGIVFDYAFCTTASCSASRSVILTGLHNHSNGQYGHEHSYNKFASKPEIKSLPVLLKQGGYRTASIGKLHVAPKEVYAFDEYLPGNSRSPVQMADNCRKFISQSKDKPFFLYYCTSDPHRGGGTAKELEHAPDRFGNKPPGQAEYPGIQTVTFSAKDVVVPPYLPDTPQCRAELAQYYQSVNRLDQGLGRLVSILKETGQYDNTLIIYISDNGIAFPGAKTTVYEPGIRLPCVVRSPQQKNRGVRSNAMISWTDLTPTILAYAGVKADSLAHPLHGRSFLGVVHGDKPEGWDEVYASHTFHEITMYYPMRVVRERRYKLIWNIAWKLDYPFATDLWEAPTWQSVLKAGPSARYGKRTVDAYLHRPQFELYDLEADPDEVVNLAGKSEHAHILDGLKKKLRTFQKNTDDPWILKWDYE